MKTIGVLWCAAITVALTGWAGALTLAGIVLLTAGAVGIARWWLL